MCSKKERLKSAFWWESMHTRGKQAAREISQLPWEAHTCIIRPDESQGLPPMMPWGGGWGWGEAHIPSQLEKRNTEGVINTNCDWRPWRGAVVSQGHVKGPDLHKDGQRELWEPVFLYPGCGLKEERKNIVRLTAIISPCYIETVRSQKDCSADFSCRVT